MINYTNEELKEKRIKNNKKNSIIRGIIMTIIIILIVLFVILLTNRLTHKNDEIGLFGYKSYLISDNSMNPEIKYNDIIILRDVNSGINEQDIITYYDKIESRYITGRVIEIRTLQDNSFKYIVKGDNVEDKKDVLENQVEGVYTKKISVIGKLFRLSQTKIIICIVVLVLVLIFFWNSKNRREERAFSRHEIRKEYEKKNYTDEEEKSDK